MRKSRHGIDTIAARNRKSRKIGSLSREFVDFLEAVEIEQQQRGRAAIGDCLREEPLAEIEEGAAVGDAGK
jgi:hypothetical protein